jgi:hypothetical protein
MSVYQEGKLSLQTENFRHETLHGIAEKTTREASLPPARLPLPALRDLPGNGLVRTPPWGKRAGINSPEKSMMARCVRWPTPWSPAQR